MGNVIISVADVVNLLQHLTPALDMKHGVNTMSVP